MRVLPRLVLSLALLVPFLGSRTALADEGLGGSIAAGPAGADAALGSWGGAIGSKIDGGTLDAFFVDVAKAGGGYAATTRAELTLTSGGATRKVVVATRYAGQAREGEIVFRSTERTRAVDGNAPEALPQAQMRVAPKGATIEARVGNDIEGYTRFTLVRRGGGLAPLPPARTVLDALLGSWGGDMSKADLGSNVFLDEMFMDVSADGGGTAVVRMNLTLKKDGSDVPIVIRARYERGRAEADAIRWDKVPWHRTVPSTGQKDDIDGNPLVLSLKPDGGMSGKFEGGDGMTFTLARRAAPKPTPLDALVGSWGGDMSKADLGSGVLLDEMFFDVSADGGATALLRMNLTLVRDAQRIPLVVEARYERGRVDGDAMRWDKVPWHRTVTQTGQKTDLDGNPLVLRVRPDGVLDGKFEGGDGFTFTLRRRTTLPGR